jgi:hypothetical protein
MAKGNNNQKNDKAEKKPSKKYAKKTDDKNSFEKKLSSEFYNILDNDVPVHNSSATERRVFYIDIGKFTPSKAEGFVKRLKDQFSKSELSEGWVAISESDSDRIPGESHEN